MLYGAMNNGIYCEDTCSIVLMMSAINRHNMPAIITVKTFLKQVHINKESLDNLGFCTNAERFFVFLMIYLNNKGNSFVLVV